MSVTKQLEAASEMQLSKEDVAKLYKRWPLRYRELAIAFGIVKVKKQKRQTVADIQKLIDKGAIR